MEGGRAGNDEGGVLWRKGRQGRLNTALVFPYGISRSLPDAYNEKTKTEPADEAWEGWAYP